MEKPNTRQILYKKSSSTVDLTKKDVGQKPANEPAQAPVIKQSTEVSDKEIFDWIKSHLLFKWSVMCDMVGVDMSNFRRIMHSEKDSMPKHWPIDKMLEILREYGFPK